MTFYVNTREVRSTSAKKRPTQSWQENHRMTEARRHLWGPSSPSPCSEQTQLQQVAQGHVLLGFEYFCGWRLAQLLWATCSLPFDHPHSKKGRYCVYLEFFVFKFVLIASRFVIGHHRGEPDSIFTALIRYLYKLMKSPALSLPFSRLSSPSFLSLSLYDGCSSPSNCLCSPLLDWLQ